MQADVHALMEGELGQWLRQQDSMRDKAREDAESRWLYGGIALVPVLLFLLAMVVFGNQYAFNNPQALQHSI